MTRASRLLAGGLMTTMTTMTAMATLAGVGCRRGGNPEAVAEAARQPTPAVSVAAVSGEDEPVTIEATGSFQAEESSEVAPETSGRVLATPVDVGQFVREGAVLVRLQGIDAGLRLEEAAPRQPGRKPP